MSSRPLVSIATPGNLNISAGETLPFVGVASDSDADLFEHWMEIQNPEGKWSWEDGGIKDPQWEGGALVGNKAASRKLATYTFSKPGTYHVRSTAADEEQPGQWSESKTLEIVVAAVDDPDEPVDNATVIFNGGAPVVTPVGSKLMAGARELYTLLSEGPYKLELTIPDVVTPPLSELWPMDAESVSNRLGPKWDGKGSRDTNAFPPTKHSEIPYGRAKDYQFGEPSPNYSNFWSESGNGLLATPRQTGLNSFRAQTYAAYNSVAVTRPFPDITGFKPDPVHQAMKLTLPFTASCRSQGIECNEAIMGNAAGDIWPAGTQTSRGGDDWPYPACNVGFEITAMALTTSNELLIAVGINPKTGAGKIAYVACQGKYLPSHTMQLTGQPNEGSWSAFKLLGVRDLPFSFPNSVSAASNGSWIGPSQTASKDLGQIDMEHVWTRDSMRDEGENDNTPWGYVFATSGVAVVSSKVAGKVAVLSLKNIFARLRADYCAHDQDAWESTLIRESKGLYPPTIDEDKTLEPSVDKVYDIPGPNFVLCCQQKDRWSLDYWKAWIAREDGLLTVIDTSPLLARYSWDARGPGGIIASKFIAKNLTHLAITRFDDWLATYNMPINHDGQPDADGNKPHYTAFGKVNSLVVTSRGENAAIFVLTNGTDLQEYRRIADVLFEDIVSATVNERAFALTVVDFGKAKGRLFNYFLGGVSSDSGWFRMDNNGRDYFRGGEPLEFDDGEHPFVFNTSNVN